MLIWNFSEHIILCKWAYLFLWKYHLLDKSHEKKLKIPGWLPCYYILFNLRWPLNREYIRNNQVFSHFVRLKSFSLFWDTSYSMRYIFSAGIWCREKHLFPNIPHFFKGRKLSENCLAENVCVSLEKMRNIWK